MNKKNELNTDALFLGAKSENANFFKETLDFLIDEHAFWRRDFHPEDKNLSSQQDTNSFKETLNKTKEVLAELTSKLKITSRPNFSPRYLGEGSDNLMIANLAYMVAILYNPSNASGEANPATTFMEMETGSQLAQMVGFNPEKAWGHITACETISNFESLWISRNLKSIPLAIKAVKPDLVSNMDDWQLLNMTSSSILNLLDKIKKEGLIDVFDEVRDHSIRGTGLKGYKLGKLIVPQSEYNAWIKAVDIFGLGLDNLIGVSLDDNFRIDVAHLDEILDSLVKKNIPILQTVVSLGNYEGAVDYVDKVVQLREKYEKNGVSFRIHVDASCGGYAFSMFLDENHNFMNFETLKLKLHSNIIIHKEIPWPSKEVHQAYKAVCKTDSVTLAPHKAGAGEAFKIAKEKLTEETRKIKKLRDKFLSGIEALDNIKINGDLKHRIVHNLSISVYGVKKEEFLESLKTLPFQQVLRVKT